MTEPALTRPPRVTTACLFMGLTCTVLVFAVGSMLSNWGSIEVQEELRTVLSREPFKGSGIAVSEAMGWLRWALMAAAAVASAGVVFAIYTARGHQASRIILTLMCAVAAVVFLAGGLVGLLPGAFSIGCALYLWSADSRRWFALKNGATPASQPASSQPAASQPAASHTMASQQLPQSPAQHTPSSAPVRATGRAPIGGMIATVLLLVFSALAALVFAANALFYLAARTEYVRILTENPQMMDTVRNSGMTVDELAHAVFLVCSVGFFIAMAALVGSGIGLAVLSRRRRQGAATGVREPAADHSERR